MRTKITGKRKVIHTLLPSYGHVQDDREILAIMEGSWKEMKSIKYAVLRIYDYTRFLINLFCNLSEHSARIKAIITVETNTTGILIAKLTDATHL